MTNNRQRWAKDQLNKARAAYVAPVQPDRLHELRVMAALLARPQFSHMANLLAEVRAEISRRDQRKLVEQQSLTVVAPGEN